MKITPKAVLVTTLLATLATQASAAVIYTRDIGLGTINVTWDETFLLTGTPSDSYIFLVTKNVFDTDIGDGGYNSQLTSINHTIYINGGGAQVPGNWGGWQYRPDAEGANAYSSLDAAFGISNPGGLLPGDTLRWTGSLTVAESSPAYLMPDNFGLTTAILASTDGIFTEPTPTLVIDSSASQVPFGVDSTTGLALLGAASLWKFRRRRKTA